MFQVFWRDMITVFDEVNFESLFNENPPKVMQSEYAHTDIWYIIIS